MASIVDSGLGLTILDFSLSLGAVGTLQEPIGVNNQVKPIVRQGMNSLSQSKSPLKRTEELISPLERTFAIRQGIHSLSDYRLKLTPMGSWSVPTRAVDATGNEIKSQLI
ncbi:MAG: hypothetical protein EAZ09_11810 [Oscillatoriales cyanobacterium]|nr:MAG: hypothetical protein EAZ18_10330 [Oscillatoriales cyanobacterium]TAH21772.1 MAG: hypothetical protein EAZ09_11810 [Oscillatoriales cyanobacterium]